MADTPQYQITTLAAPDPKRGGGLLTLDDIEYWLTQQLEAGWELVGFGPQTWRPGSMETVWIFRRVAVPATTVA